MANPLKTKAIASAKIKSDKVDARILAHLLRSNLVAESYVPPKHLREIRALIRHRVAIVKIRTMVKNQVHALVDKHGLACPYSDMFGKGGLEWLRSLQLPSLDRLILDNHLTHLESLNQQTERVDEEIHSKACEDRGRQASAQHDRRRRLLGPTDQIRDRQHQQVPRLQETRHLGRD